ncbi:MAG: membrane integrity-associated transporter subunit PqiC [Acidobacteria bacterium]|nr:membrane integrity-associated transporter subunit PqiC [Acidobacteriota bacterium]MBV9476103.1 membrane integrity-associated transporter subunit PqiC [Acidobacteriota bacterium]
MSRRIALLGLLLAFAGCSFFSRSKSRFFSLERIPPTTSSAAGSTSVTATATPMRGIPIGIDGIELPPGVDRREIVVQKADHQLEVRSTDQWSAAFSDAVLHTLAFDLAARMPEGMMILPGETIPAGATRGLSIAVAEFSAGPANTITLDAHWTLRAPGVAAISHREQITIDIASLDSAQIADGMSRALAALADRIAAQV